MEGPAEEASKGRNKEEDTGGAYVGTTEGTGFATAANPEATSAWDSEGGREDKEERDGARKGGGPARETEPDRKEDKKPAEEIGAAGAAANPQGSPEETTPDEGTAEEKREVGRAPGAEAGGPETRVEEDRRVERRTEEPEEKSLATSADR